MAHLKQFPPPYKYSSLSIKDLLDARDAYHWHLSHLTNVIATSIGLYRIRVGDWYENNPPNTKKPTDWINPEGARTVYNSVVKPWSWPCVLVFVREWVELHEFATSPDQMVPRALFLSDGRVIPTCTVFVGDQAIPSNEEQHLSFPESFIGGGYLMTTVDQGREHLGSVGCLVTDGKLIYSLTNKHVAGEPGREIYAYIGGERMPIGISDARQLGKIPFTKSYPEWPGTYVQSNVDVGLVRIDDLSQWTTQIRSLGPLDMPLDLTTRSLTLDLIDCKVRAYGGASGELSGKVIGLFYRYKSIGGSDYVTDFLIAPQTKDDRSTLHGDSGTLWCLEEPVRTEEATAARESREVSKVRYRPFAIQWGGHTVVEQSGQKMRAHAMALATNLSTVCRELDLDVLRDWNSGLPQYWGSVGHYTIGAKACDAIMNENLRELMLANISRISYNAADIDKHTGAGLSKPDVKFVPLADVPDMVWKSHPWAEGGRNPNPNKRLENPNHFADMDKGLPKDDTFTDGNRSVKIEKDATLLELCADPDNVSVGLWRRYYEEVGDKGKGLLPFRVQQIYRAMVKAVEDGDRERFVCAAGIMTHYVGDACQPLHISYKHDGDPDRPVEKMQVYNRTKKKWEWKENQPLGSGVHSAYEDDMVNYHVGEIKTGIDKGITGGDLLPDIKDARDAAVLIVELMRKTFHTINPDEIIEVFAPFQGDPPKKFNGAVPKAVADALWAAFGDKTIKVMTEGCRYLAHLWDSAWKAGKGDQTITEHSLIAEATLSTIYLDHEKFVPSVTLDDIEHLLNDPPK
jgi:hypothetical protein